MRTRNLAGSIRNTVGSDPVVVAAMRNYATRTSTGGICLVVV